MECIWKAISAMKCQLFNDILQRPWRYEFASHSFTCILWLSKTIFMCIKLQLFITTWVYWPLVRYQCTFHLWSLYEAADYSLVGPEPPHVTGLTHFITTSGHWSAIQTYTFSLISLIEVERRIYIYIYIYICFVCKMASFVLATMGNRINLNMFCTMIDLGPGSI